MPLADLFGVSKSSACDIITEVSYLIASKLRAQYIRAPENDIEILNAKATFHKIGKFPLVFGAIDGTHFKVRSFLLERTRNYIETGKPIFPSIAKSADVSIVIHLKFMYAYALLIITKHDPIDVYNRRLLPMAWIST